MKASRNVKMYGIKTTLKGEEINFRKIPWINKEHGKGYLEFFNGILNLNSELLEFDSGGSSFYIARRVKHLTTFERDEMWHKVMREEIAKRNISNITIHFDPDYPENFHCTKPCFDVVIIDSWNKSIEKCLKTAMDCLRVGGYLFFDYGIEELRKGGWILLKTWGNWRTMWRKPECPKL